MPLNFAGKSRRSSAEDQPVQEFSQLRWQPEPSPAPSHKAPRIPASLDVGEEKAAMLNSEASSTPDSYIETASFSEEVAAIKGRPSFELNVNVTRNPARNHGASCIFLSLFPFYCADLKKNASRNKAPLMSVRAIGKISLSLF